MSSAELAWSSSADGGGKKYKVGVILSEPIRPYLEAFYSFKEKMEKDNAEVRVFELRARGTVVPEKLRKTLLARKFDIWVAVGPQAMECLEHIRTEQKIKYIYGMVLNPDEIADTGCGVPLNIPIAQQLNIMKKVFPNLHNVGVLFDPRYNRTFVRKATSIASHCHMKLIPIEILERSEIPKVLNDTKNIIDIVWLIPDFTVISESVVRYIIKEELANRKVVVGYNKFFFKTGAAMSFILNYKEIGKQMARLCKTVLLTNNCPDLSPRFEVWVNSRVLDILGINIPARNFPGLVVMP